MTSREPGPINKRRKMTYTDQESELCQLCETLDLDAIIEQCSQTFQRVRDGKTTLSTGMTSADDGTHYYVDAIAVHMFQDRLSEPSICPLCTFFRAHRVQPERHTRHKLLAFRSSDSWLYETRQLRAHEVYNEYEDSVFLAVVPDLDSIPRQAHEINWLNRDIPATGAIYLQREIDYESTAKPKLFGARELGDKCNFEVVQECLDFCQKHHGISCNRRTSHDPITRGFRLIDCTKSPPVVEDRAWGTPYVALSYVWGARPEDAKDWPATVLDAVEVTKEFGFQYLWVDRLCINQSDPDEKSYLISNMTTIYEAAELTIVAAAGMGASDGLPGVGSTPRRPQPKYALNSGSMLLSILRDPRHDILESQYWTRGWTYQEGVLSNRHLVFTDYQIYYECHGMVVHESIGGPQFQMSVSDSENSDVIMADFMLSGIFKRDTYSGGSLGHQNKLAIFADDGLYRLDYGFPLPEEVNVRSQLRGLNEHIREFSKRNLTHDTDTLEAFKGIVGLYRQTTQLHLLHGIPIWIGDLTAKISGAQITFALSVCSWYHRTGTSLSMFVSDACRRKPQFPSWTWAGWAGTVTWRAAPEFEHCAYMSDIIAAPSLHLIWAASIHLHNGQRSRPLNLYSSARLARDAPMLMEIKNPLLLDTFERVETKNKWHWFKIEGRPGHEQHTVPTEWDGKWHRIGRRLCNIGTSVPMTEREWTIKHASRELISVLIFAGKFFDNEHGTARFLTLRKIDGSDRWMRVGVLYLILPFLNDCPDIATLLGKIPVSRSHRFGGPIVVQ